MTCLSLLLSMSMFFSDAGKIRCDKPQDGPWSYTVEASFLEIYNENLRDLLAGGGEGGGRSGNVSTR